MMRMPNGVLCDVSGIKFLVVRIEGINVMFERLTLQNNRLNGWFLCVISHGCSTHNERDYYCPGNPPPSHIIS